MKNKRFLSLMLAMVLTVSLFAGITATAYADDSNIITYTVQKNDYLWLICKKNGLDYYTCKDAIMLLNSFTTETQLNRLYVGQNIKLPASNAVAQTVTETTTTTVSVGSTVVNTSSSTTSASTDAVAYYLVCYTVKSGDTLYQICNSLGTSYALYADQIMTINGLTSVTHIWAGKTIYIPVTSKPTSGTYYSVVKHKVSSGETVTSICNNYGINYSANTKLVQGLNDGYNLNSIKVGQTIYVPTTKNVTPVTPTATPTATATSSPTTGEYKITFNSGANGSPYATKNGSAVTTANAGDTITIIADPDPGYIVESLTVTKKSGAVITVSSGTFTMPAYDVIVTVKYTTGQFTIDYNTPQNGSVDILVNGYEGTTANNGDKITLVITPYSGYKISSVTYSDSGNTITVNPDSNGKYYFYMPKHNVKLSVKFTIATYLVPVFVNGTGSDSDASASLVVEQDGLTVTGNKMYEGGTYIIKIAPASKCAVDTEVATSINDTCSSFNIKATKIDSTTYQVYLSKINDKNNKLTISAKVNKTNAFELKYSSNISSCTATFKVCKSDGLYANAVVSTTAAPGKKVYIIPNAIGDCVFSSVTATFAGGVSPVSLTLDSSVGMYYFTMPSADVTANLNFTQTYTTKYSFITVKENSNNIDFKSYDESGNCRSKYSPSEWVRIDPTEYIPSGYTIDHIEVESSTFTNRDLGQSTRNGVTGYWVQFPSDAIWAKVVIKQSTVVDVYKPIMVKSTDTTFGTAEIRANGVSITPTASTTYPDYYEGQAKVGATIQVYGIPNTGYKVNCVYYDSGKLLNPDANGNYYYTIKDTDDLTKLTFDVEFVYSGSSSTSYAIKNSNPTNGELWFSKYDESESKWIEYKNGESATAVESQNICIKAKYDNSQYGIGIFSVDGRTITPKITTSGTESIAEYTFLMPDHEINVVVTFSEITVG